MDASLYHKFYEVEDRHWWFAGRRAIVAGELARRLPRSAPERRILDVGCGTGGMLPILAPHGRVSGIDMEPLALDYCRRRGFADVALQQGFVPAQPLDVITLFDVLEHVPDEAGFLRLLSGWLKPGGLIVITVPAFPWLWSRHDDLNHHQRRYRRGQLVGALTGNGFRVERASYFNFLLFPVVVATRLLERAPKPGTTAEEEVLKHLTIGRLNGALTRLFGAERHLLGVGDLPWGVSLLAVARKPE